MESWKFRTIETHTKNLLYKTVQVYQRDIMLDSCKSEKIKRFVLGENQRNLSARQGLQETPVGVYRRYEQT